VTRGRGRLSRSEDFNRVYRLGRSAANKYLILYYFERPASLVGTAAGRQGAEQCSRIGFSVSKRIGNAVERNRVKRVLREVCRLNESLFRPDLDFVLIARPPIGQLLESEGYKGVEAKTIEVLRKASFVTERDRAGH
jgi:ribonuclease P protein component